MHPRVVPLLAPCAALTLMLLAACSAGESVERPMGAPETVVTAPAATPATTTAATAAPATGAPATGAPADALASPADSARLTMTVYKTPTCGCCSEWVDHVKANGFNVVVHDLNELTAIKREKAVPERLMSCHTAVVGDYVIEGHVPAADIQRLLRERPSVIGLAVPGMPMGSPGMEGPRRDPYNVIAFARDGSQVIFARH